jgi:transposase
MQPIIIGLDLAKHVFQVHGIAADGQVVLRRQVRRSELLKFFRALPPCLVGMEACASDLGGLERCSEGPLWVVTRRTA